MPDQASPPAAARRPYRPISEYAPIGNLETAALVAPDGSIDWGCLPRFDSPSVFAAILDDRRGGRFRIRPVGAAEGRQRYANHTNVLETIFETDHGRLVLSDFMPLSGDLNAPRPGQAAPELWRLLHAEGGGVEVEIEWAPRLDYGRAEMHIERAGDGFVGRVGGDPGGVNPAASPPTVLSGLRAAEIEAAEIADDGGPVVRARVSLGEGERRVVACALADRPSALDVDAAVALRDETVDAWRRWLHKIGVAERAWARPYQELVTRSELALKLMCYPTGAIVAAPTTSLPECVGGMRNWDYRYSWIRDAALTVQALLAVGHEEEARRFILWSEEMARQESDAPKTVQIMYGIGGETDLPEHELDHLEGYRGSRPVRIGNGAAAQRQHDVYGELLDGAYELIRSGVDLPADVRRFLATVADSAAGRLHDPDEGIWEVRSGEQQFTYSKLMLWVCLDRAVRLAQEHRLTGDVERWRGACEEVREMVLERGFNRDLGAFTQTLDGEHLDASLLTLPIHELLPADDPRVLGTIDRVLEQLTDHELVYRYHADDGLPGEEGAFVLCSFWMVDALALAGRVDEAERAFDSLVRRVSDVGLYSEQIDPATGTFLGNFPQAFSHLGLINSAIYLAHARGDSTAGAAPAGSRHLRRQVRG